MKSSVSRLLLVAVAALVSWLALSGASSKGGTQKPDRLIILSTTDVKGKTSPCG